MRNAQLTKETKQRAVKEALLSSGYQFQTVTFLKKDGTLRKMNGRLFVKSKTPKSGVKRGPSKAVLAGEQMVFWDRNAGFRTITLANVVRIAGMGKVRKFPVL